MNSKISISVDIDWAPEEIIQDTLELLEQFGVKATLFITHKSKVIDSINQDQFEVALHPNFNPLLEGRNNKLKHQKAIIEDLLMLYPKSKGIRSHSLTQNQRLLDLFSDMGFLYESNTLLPYFESINPYKLWNNLYSIPLNWQDNIHYMYGKEFTNIGLNLAQTQLAVFNFHPIHIFLNTDNEICYNNARPYYHNYKQLKSCVNTEKTGVRDVFINLLKQCNQENNYKLIELIYDKSR